MDSEVPYSKDKTSTEKKLICYTSRKASHVRKETHPKLNSLPQSRISYTRRCKLKPRSHIKRTRTRSRILNGSQIGAPQKISDHLSVKSQALTNPVGKKKSCCTQRGNRKSAATDGPPRQRRERKRRKRRKKIVEQDEASRVQRRVRYLLINIKRERNLIDAYSGDGWRGHSREKIRPKLELQRAEKQILRCKLGIRDAIHQLHVLSCKDSTEGSFDQDESFSHEHIICAKCKTNKVLQDNDIILCDGTCNCGFHQKCLVPPLEKKQGWLCKFCECKMGILDVINAHLGTRFTVKSGWEDIFIEEAKRPDVQNNLSHPSEEWPSEDSEDEDYHPERSESCSSKTGQESVSDNTSSSNHLQFSSDEARSYSNISENCHDEGPSHVKHRSYFDHANSIVSIDSAEASDREITSHRRRRRDVDYKKLHDEMFGKELTRGEEQSEDEDWGPCSKRRKKIEADYETSVVKCGGDAESSDVVRNEEIPGSGKPFSRIPPAAREKLREVFAENELPSRAVKEKLSKQFGISSEKVSKWFNNARYAALKIRKAEMTGQPSTSKIIRRSQTDAINNGSSDEVTSVDDSCVLPLARNLRRILCRKTGKPITSKPLKERHKISYNALTPDKEQKRRGIVPENKLSSMFVERGSPGEFAITSYQADGMANQEELCLDEVEKLCHLEGRIQKLKKALLACEVNNHVSNRTCSRKQIVVYVPVAEVKEKDQLWPLSLCNNSVRRYSFDNNPA